VTRYRFDGLTTAIVIIAAFVIWKVSGTLFVIFAGLIAATIFRSAGNFLAEHTSAPRSAMLITVYLVFSASVLGGAVWGGSTLVSQFGELSQTVQTESQRLFGFLDKVDESTSPPQTSENQQQQPLSQDQTSAPQQQDPAPYRQTSSGEDNNAASIADYLPDTASLIDSARTAFNTTLGVLGNLLVVVFIGIFVSWQPEPYRKGLISLVPPARRERIGEVLSESVDQLAKWIAGQGIAMLVIFLASWLVLWLIDMPFAFLLALQAGLLAFIPTIGPLLAGIPIIFAGMSVSPNMLIWGLATYLAIQMVESNLLTPIVQQRATALPPALTLGFQLVMGALFGLPGLIVAVPMLAIILTLVRRLYVEDVLGGPASGSRRSASDKA
tara:strand:+ start:433 stop:1581 length:1149 start_codon:yes stop_codon:yes gene_type:complete